MKNYILILNVLLFISCNMNYICKNNDENLKQICNIIVKTWDKNNFNKNSNNGQQVTEIGESIRQINSNK